MKAQQGISLHADFEERTWTFAMPERFEVTAGKFAIVPASDFESKLWNLAQGANANVEVEYWKKRCELAEDCLDTSPCDPDINDEQIEARQAYMSFIASTTCP